MASEAGVPLVVLSADRPPELLGCGSNQTTDQVGLYGRHVRFFAQLGEPHSGELCLRAAKRAATRAVFEATGLHPGPAHLNAQARKPLEPTAPRAEDADARDRVEAVMREPLSAPVGFRGVSGSTVERVARALEAAARPLILCGPAPVVNATLQEPLQALADRAAVAVTSESTGQVRFGSESEAVIGAFDALWRTKRGGAALVPDFVLQLGANPTSKGWEDLCANHRIRRVVVHPWEWVDPASNAELVVQGDIARFVSALASETNPAAERDPVFSAQLRRAEELAWQAASEVLAEAGDGLTEGVIARSVREASPEGSAVVLGNSLPIRNFDTWVPPGGASLRVFSQRGVSGIDGVVSGAAGVASCTSEPTTLIVGDVSFLHDINGLQLASQATSPLVIVVVNNGGGRIFEQLPIASRGKEEWLRYFTTPHEANLSGAASIYGCAFETVGAVSELRAALESAHAEGGCTVIEAVVPPHGSAEQNAALRSRIEQALQREGL